MRNAFASELTSCAERDRRIVLLSGDIGNRMFDDFKQRFPTRFFNCGVAESNMMSVAAGMALSGLRPVVYTITPFVTFRCLEQIRVDVCYHEASVVIVGVGGGLSYASLGATHHSCEDVATLRVLPGMRVICPGDRWETSAALRAALSDDAPTYLRLGKKGEPDVHGGEPEFEVGRGISIRAGKDLVVLSTGNLLPIAVEATDVLRANGIDAGVVSLHTVKPLDHELLVRCFSSAHLVATLEEHSVLGGLGGAVSEWLCEQRNPRARLLRIGTSDKFLHAAGDQAFARQQFGLDLPGVVRTLETAYDDATSRR